MPPQRTWNQLWEHWLKVQAKVYAKPWTSLCYHSWNDSQKTYHAHHEALRHEPLLYLRNLFPCNKSEWGKYRPPEGWERGFNSCANFNWLVTTAWKALLRGCHVPREMEQDNQQKYCDWCTCLLPTITYHMLSTPWQLYFILLPNVTSSTLMFRTVAPVNQA